MENHILVKLPTPRILECHVASFDSSLISPSSVFTRASHFILWSVMNNRLTFWTLFPGIINKENESDINNWGQFPRIPLLRLRRVLGVGLWSCSDQRKWQAFRPVLFARCCPHQHKCQRNQQWSKQNARFQLSVSLCPCESYGGICVSSGGRYCLSLLYLFCPTQKECFPEGEVEKWSLIKSLLRVMQQSWVTMTQSQEWGHWLALTGLSLFKAQDAVAWHKRSHFCSSGGKQDILFIHLV